MRYEALMRTTTGTKADAVSSILFIGPALLIYGLFTLFPALDTLRLSATDATGLNSQANFVGLANFGALAADATVGRVLLQTAQWLVLHVVLAGGAGLAFAVAIASLARTHVFFRTAFFLPHVVSLAVVGVIWAKIYDPYFGLLNGALDAFGLGMLKLGWLSDPALVIFSVNVASSWQGFGIYMLLFVAGLQNIDNSLYEAAEIDGAGVWQRFRHVTIPGLREVMTFVVSLALINGLKGFATIWVMTQGGPFYRSELLTTYIVKLAFQFQEQGRAAALCVVLCALAMAITVAFNRWRESLR
ncbi:MAG: sugar ABC transporter permease [Rhodospirillales bacterium]|nr:sugar ABC transporter permease [Rhodospirillales bacterium]